MPRSYFSRVTRGEIGAALQPPRPVTTLWKATRLEWLASCSTLPKSAAPPRTVTKQGAPSLEGPVPLSDCQTATLGSAKARLQAGPPAVRLRGIEPGPPHAMTQTTAAPRQPGSQQASARVASPAKPSRVTASSTDSEPGVRRSQSFLSASVSTPLELAPTPSHTPVGPTRGAELAGSARTSNGAGGRRSRDSAIPDPSPPPAHLPALAPVPRERSAGPRQRETPAGQESRSQSQATPPEGNKVEIGKLEVQVIAPPPSVPPPPVSRARLARGYSLWPAW